MRFGGFTMTLSLSAWCAGSTARVGSAARRSAAIGKKRACRPESQTETFVALKLFLDNWRWQDVPFYLRTGKRLTRQVSEVAIQFRAVPHRSFPPEATLDWQSSRLVMSIQPDQGIVLRFQAKHPGPKMHLRTVEMKFNYQETFAARSPEAYETLLWDVMKNDRTLFMRADQVEAAWRLLMPVFEVWAVAPPSDFPNYAAGTWGPEAAQALSLNRDTAGRCRSTSWMFPRKSKAESRLAQHEALAVIAGQGGQMKEAIPITALFLDIGGVLLTNGWDRHARERAARTFDLDADEMEERHHLTFDTYEVGKLTLEEYLSRVVFYEDRPFTPDKFRRFMFEQSQPFPEMIELANRLKARHRLKIAVVSNEGRELTEHRIRSFKLNEFVDFFISSCFVHFRKPDTDIFKIALDIAQVPPGQVVYIDDRPMFVQVAEGLGINGILHKDYESTRAKLAAFGLVDNDE